MLVVLSIGEGSFDRGFPVTVQIGEQGLHPTVAETGRLPALPKMPSYYSRWQSSYGNWGVRTRISVRKVTPLFLKEDCHKAAQILRERFNTWLRSDEFRPIQDLWRETLAPSDEIRVLLQTNNAALQRLPWHLWDVFERYTKAEIGLSSPAFRPRSPSSRAKTKVNILAISGNSDGIDIEGDRTLLKQLPDAEVTFLVDPTRQELTDHLRQKPWDILFFAGHSDSQKDGHGRIYLNRTDSLTIVELRHALRKAAESGLKLAIFNSCDGLGLARDLADLQIPQTIFMRESVPDRVAQEFLKYFLTTFSQGESLYLSIRTARERLEALEDEFPYATWLPVIYQHPAEIPPTWHDLTGAGKSKNRGELEEEDRNQPKASRLSLVGTLLISASMMAGVLGVRHLGLLQAWELKGYDQMLQVRSLIQPEPPDNRILVVEITDKDYEAQKTRRENLGDKSLSDTSLIRLLDVLEKYHPRAIGLDLSRDDAKVTPIKEIQRLQQAKTLFGACKGSNKADLIGVAPPSGIPKDRIGFADAVEDVDGVFRRQILSMKQYPESLCQAPNALSTQLAFAYLKAQGIIPSLTSDEGLKLGNTVFKPLAEASGHYQRTNLAGSQILLNYRATDPLSVPLTEVLQDVPSLASAVRDRIIVIGVNRQNIPDMWLTPFSSSKSEAKPGVTLVAQQVSHILSAVLDGRPLLHPWQWWVEVIWISGWASIGGVLMWQLRSPFYKIVAVVTISGIVWVVCFGFFIQGSVAPVIPPVLILVLTGITAVVYQAHTSRVVS